MQIKLTSDDFKKGTKIYQGKLNERFFFNFDEIFKTSTNVFYKKTDMQIIPTVASNTIVEIYQVSDNLVMLFKANNFYTFIKPVKIIESQTVQQFDGFEPNKIYTLINGQKWQQIDDTYAPNHISAGYVKILNDKVMMVDSWSFFPNVKLLNY